MKRIFTLAVISLMFLGAVAAQETDRELERCGDAVCAVAEAQGLYAQLGEINSDIEEVRSVLARCQTDYCRSVAANADKRVGLVSKAEVSSNSGDMEATIESLREIQDIVHRDIAASEKELEGGETDGETVEKVLDLEERISSNVSSALESSSVAAVVEKAVRCPDGKCGAEVSEAAKNVVKFKAGAELSKSVNTGGFQDLDSDGDGISDVVEGRVEEDGTIYCWGRRCEVPSRAELDNDGSVYCWGNRCEMPSEVMQTDYDGEVYCWGQRCEVPSAEKSTGEGNIYCWGSSCQVRSDDELVEAIASESGPSTSIDASENQSEKAQESISKRSARTGRNPETGKEIQSIPDEESERENESRFGGELKDATMGNRQTNQGVNPVNDPPTASPRERVSAAITQRLEKITLAVENMYQE